MRIWRTVKLPDTWKANAGVLLIAAAAMGAILIFIGLPEIVHILAGILFASFLCLSIFRMAQKPSLAFAVIALRVVVVLFAAAYVQPTYQTDTLMYHEGGVEIAHSLRLHGSFTDPGEAWGTNAYIIFTGIAYTLLGDHLLPLTLFNSLIGGLGSLMFYRAIVENYGEPHWLIKYVLLFEPSSVYWSSIHGKDPWVFFFLALLTLSVSRMICLRLKRWAVVYFLAFGGLFLIRPHVALLCAGCAMVALAVHRWKKRENNPALKLTLLFSTAGVLLATVLTIGLFLNVEDFSGAALLNQLSTLLQGMATGGSALDIPPIDSWSDLLAYLPKGMLVVAFRPFPWEGGNPFIQLAAFDQVLVSAAVLLILFGLMRRFLHWRAREPGSAPPPVGTLGIFLVLYSIGFMVLYAAISANLGTLVREKVQWVPFLWCAACALRFARKKSRGTHLTVPNPLSPNWATKT